MINRYSETTGIAGDIGMSPFKAVLWGLLVFPLSFYILFWNEGREDLSKIAKTAIIVNSEIKNQDISLENKLISTAGVVTSEEQIGDELFLKPKVFLLLERKVEVYSWVEKKISTNTNDRTGNEITKNTEIYTTEWVNNPQKSDDFVHPEGHSNTKK